MGYHSLLQGIFPTWGSNPGLPHCRQILYHLKTDWNLGCTMYQGPFWILVPGTTPWAVIVSVLLMRKLRKNWEKTDEKTEAQGCYVNCLKSYSKDPLRPEVKPRLWVWALNHQTLTISWYVNLKPTSNLQSIYLIFLLLSAGGCRKRKEGREEKGKGSEDPRRGEEERGDPRSERERGITS